MEQLEQYGSPEDSGGYDVAADRGQPTRSVVAPLVDGPDVAKEFLRPGCHRPCVAMSSSEASELRQSP
jgi:hypothetical protein